MQIFQKGEYVEGIEYREKNGKPRKGTIIIEDDSPEADKIRKGFDFDIVDGKLKIEKDKRKDVKDREKKDTDRKDRRHALKTRLAGRPYASYTLDDLREIVVALGLEAGIIDEYVEPVPEPIEPVTP